MIESNLSLQEMGTMEEEDVGNFLLDHPDFLKDWILNHADQKVVEDLSEVIQVKKVNLVMRQFVR